MNDTYILKQIWNFKFFLICSYYFTHTLLLQKINYKHQCIRKFNTK